MSAMGKQKLLTDKLTKYKQLLIREGYSDLVESTKINKIRINEYGEVYDFDEKYNRFNEEDDEPVYSNKFIKKKKPDEMRKKIDIEHNDRVPKKKGTKKVSKIKSNESNSYLNQYSSKKLLGETGNQKKNAKKTGKLRTATKSAKNLRETPIKKKTKNSQIKEKSGKSKKRQKSSVVKEKTGGLKKNYSMKSHQTYENSGNSMKNSNKSSKRRKSTNSGYKTDFKTKVSSGFQKIDKLQARRIERREKSNQISKGLIDRKE